MGTFHLIMIIISFILLTIIINGLSDFYMNYDYIANFVNRYNKYIFYTYPSFYYVDKSKYDPNDDITNSNKKYRCFLSNGYYYAGNEDYIVVDNNKIEKKFININDCYSFIFNKSLLNVSPLCTNTSNTTDVCNSIISTFIQN